MSTLNANKITPKEYVIFWRFYCRVLSITNKYAIHLLQHWGAQLSFYIFEQKFGVSLENIFVLLLKWKQISLLTQCLWEEGHFPIWNRFYHLRKMHASEQNSLPDQSL